MLEPCAVKAARTVLMGGKPERAYLSELETAIEKSVEEAYNVKKRGIFIGKVSTPGTKAKYKFLATKLFTVRFADDVIVLTKSRRMIEEAVRPCIVRFLKERGLWLSDGAPSNIRFMPAGSPQCEWTKSR
jgi:hypothetical protein